MTTPKFFDARALAWSFLTFCGMLPTQAQFTVQSGLLDQTNTEALGLTAAPGTQTFSIYKASATTDKYVNGVVLIGFKDHLYCMWQTSPVDEDSADTRVVYSRSADGVTWSAPALLAPDPNPNTFEYRSSGGWWVNDGTLVAYFNHWDVASPKGGYTEYATSTDGINWSSIQRVKMLDGSDLTGIFEQDPHALPIGGRIISAAHFKPGTQCNPIYTDDPSGVRGWVRPAYTNLDNAIEPSWFYRSDNAVVMISRAGANNLKYASVSTNSGQSWTPVALTTVPEAKSKQSAGNLPDGTAYIVSNPVSFSRRSPLVILLSKGGSVFDRGYLLRRGGSDLPARVYTGSAKTHGYSYPKSTLWNGYLYSGYSVNKEEACCTRVSITALQSVGRGSASTTPAESATTGGGVTTASNATSKGTYVDFPATGGFIQFNSVNGGSGGQAILTVRFANGSAGPRTGSLTVNGVPQSITFPVTTGKGTETFVTNDPPSSIVAAPASYTNWTLMDVFVPLNGGATNTLRFESTGQDLANIDEITVTPAAANPITLAATDGAAGEYGSDKSLLFTVSRGGDTSNTFVVPLMASGTATPLSDYTGLPASVVIPAGAASAAVGLTVRPDDLPEGQETVALGVDPESGFATGPAATGFIADTPAQDYYFTKIADPAQRGPLDNPDHDSNPNVTEYFMGSDPGSGASDGTLAMIPSGPASFKVRYPRAKNHPDVAASLNWSVDLAGWFASGASDGARTVTFVETVVSPGGQDPETVEATATIAGAATSRVFARLVVKPVPEN